jgi:hypothetical protein
VRSLEFLRAPSKCVEPLGRHTLTIYEDLNRLARLQRELKQFDDAQRLGEAARRFEEMRRAAGYQNDVVQHLLEIQERYRQTWAGVVGAADHLGEFQRATDLYREILRSTEAAREINEWTRLSSLRPHDSLQADWARLANQSLLLWQSSLGTLSTQLDAAASIASAATRRQIIAPPYAFSEFSRATLGRLSAAPGAAEQDRLGASLVLAEHQLSSGTELVGAALAALASSGGSTGGGGRGPDTPVSTGGEPNEGDSEEEEPNGAPGSETFARDSDSGATKLFALQQEELLASDRRVVFSHDGMLAASPTARASELGRRLVNAVAAINRCQLLVGGQEVFTPTTAGFVAANTLAYIAVTDQQSLGDAVDALYVLIYESSAEMKRVLRWIPAADCDPVWNLKHLRNCWLRHDPQHGSAADQATKFAKLRESLTALGAPTMPHSASDFQRLYERLLDELCGTLEHLLTTIAGQGA